MRIHGMMLIRDEIDVIGETLAAAVEWCDRIYVFDNGSTDGTWEYVRDLGHPNVVPFKTDPATYSDSLRADIFEQYRTEVDEGDWWCWLDSDEFYVDNPRDFLTAVPEGYGEVWSSSYQFYFTDADAARYEADPQAFLATPVPERLRHYLNNWSESRFFRHHPGLVWPRNSQGRAFGHRPVGLGQVYPQRIRLRHYQFRSPEQIQYRLDMRATDPNFPHERREDWVANVIGVPPVHGPRWALRAGSNASSRQARCSKTVVGSSSRPTTHSPGCRLAASEH